MSFDPSVLSDIGASGPDIPGAKARAFQLKDMVNVEQLNQLKLNREKISFADDQKAKGILSSSNLSTSEGLSSAQEKLNRAGLPDKAMELRKHAQQVESGDLDNRIKQMQVYQYAADFAGGQIAPILAQASSMRQSGKSDAIVHAYIASQIPVVFDNVQKSNLPDDLKKQALQKLGQEKNMTFDQLLAAEANNKQVRETLKLQIDEMSSQAGIERGKAETRQGDERIAIERAKLKLAQQNAGTGSISPEAQKLKDDLRAKDKSFLQRLSNKGLGELNKTIQDWADQGKTADDIISSEISSKEQAATEVAFDKGKQGDAVRAINVGVQHMGVLKDAIVALKNGNNVAFNAARQSYKQLTGDDIPTNFDAAAEFVGNEVSKAGIGAGASGALADREGVKKNLSRSASGKQLEGQMDVYTGLLAGQMTGLERQYKSGKGTHWDDKVAPETKAALDRSKKSDGPKKINSDDDYDALPSGTEFIAPDGSKRKKP